MKIHTWNILFWMIMIPLLIVFLSFAEKQNNQRKCKGFSVSIDYNGKNYLFTAKDIEEQVISTFNTLKGLPAEDIIESDIEHEIERNPFVLNAEVYTTINGNCIADVEQRNPIVHFIGSHGNSFYAGANGALMPDNMGMPVRVKVASGFFPLDTIDPALHDVSVQVTKNKQLKEIYRIARHIEDDPVLKPAVEQIYCNKEGQYEMVTKLGDHSVLIGKAKNLDAKLSKLRLFYKKALNHGGWEKYQQLNLKYENQIVCKK